MNVRPLEQHSTRLWPFTAHGTVALVTVGALLVVAFMVGVQVGRQETRPVVAMEGR